MTEKDLVEKAVANALFPYLIGADLEEEAARAALQAIEERGYVVVPREPTEAMIAELALLWTLMDPNGP